MNAPTTDHELGRARLWERARYLLAEVLALIGFPSYLARLRWITPAQRREFLKLIKPLESAARVLIYLHLYELPRVERRARPVPAPQERPAPQTPREPDDAPLPEDSSLWSASFPLPGPSLPPAEGAGAPSRSPARQPELCDARPLAKRIEAVWRVITDPREALMRYAGRMGFSVRAAIAVRPPPEEWTLAQRIMAIGKADFAAAVAAYDTG